MAPILFWLTSSVVPLSVVTAAPVQRSAGPMPATVVLLSSLESPKLWYKQDDWSIQDDLEKTFRKAFDPSGFRVVVQRHADAWALRQALMAPENVGVFWVSHAADSRPQGSGILEASSIIADIHGADVKEVFQSVHPGLRYLGVVGCFGNSLFEGFRKEGFYRNTPSLQIGSFSSTVDAVPGLIYQLNQAVFALGDPDRSRTYRTHVIPNPDHPEETERSREYFEVPRIVANADLLESPNRPFALAGKTRKMRITRSFPSQVKDPNSLLPVKVMLGDQLIAVLPRPVFGKKTTYTIDVPFEAFQQDNADILSVETGLTSVNRAPLELGSFSFEVTGLRGSWSLYTDRSGKAIGVNGRIYNFEPPSSKP